ncbi:FAD:protein FMN transferase [Pseudoalteromonas denitrificans]|uniref:FAD:protein FMN transferase n=1 Tax=Pseudoalteromonas denitrificans DSM 6059 TaxID=1123010 RepID=A0A1I1SMG6_9GAMM|nr:FAD:protein FMN transferase [Pseudoalteromonas denitrificans]SFD47636.1 thiamine biosynthesis lipoprotein [Pseudoalteromonas denitrificans DSM 6059]
MRLFFYVILFISSLSTSSVFADWYRSDKAIMGTQITVELWADSQEQGNLALKLAMAEMHRIDELMSPYKNQSELSKLNQSAAKKPVLVSSELFNIIKKSIEISELTQGAFDITSASIGFLYDYRNKHKPSEQSLKNKLAAINYQKLILNENVHSIYFAHPDIKVDLGGIAKGYAVDNVLTLLRRYKISNAMVTAGGDTGLLGDRRGRPWIVGIRDPRNKDKQAVQLPLQNEALSTSGDYERYFEENGVRYHHILHPKTGRSVSQVQSVSIIGSQSIMTDALSTSVFVLGVKSGLALINSLEGYDAIILDKYRKLHYSEELMASQ